MFDKDIQKREFIVKLNFSCKILLPDLKNLQFEILEYVSNLTSSVYKTSFNNLFLVNSDDL